MFGLNGRFVRSLLGGILSVLLTFIVTFEMLPPSLVQAMVADRLPSSPFTINDDSSVPFTGSHYIQDTVSYAPGPAPTTNSSQIVPDKDSAVTSPSGKLILQIPKGAVSSATDIQIVEYQTNKANPGLSVLGEFDFNATNTATGVKISQFAQKLHITINNSPEDLKGIDLQTLRLYYLDENTHKWLPVPDSKFDQSTGILTATTNHFSHYGEMANPLVVGPGAVLAAQVGLQSGSATFAYPIELPTGPGGFQPQLVLSYNSASVDQMKNKQDVGSWVGLGWSLDFGYVSKDVLTDTYQLSLSGASYNLVTPDGTNYYTQPEKYLKIVHTVGTGGNDKWEVWDNAGVYYRFGGTTDSVRYLPIIQGGDYRWDLNLWRDTNNNQATVTYSQDVKSGGQGSWVRSARPTSLDYGSIHVAFSASYDFNDPTDGYMRYDDPKSYGSNPAPRVMENYKLDSISVSIGSTLIRKYNLAYDHTNASQSTDYGGIYYSGQYTLGSITQIGADGTSPLPATQFTYQNKEIYFHSSVGGDYSGNPGNAAVLQRAHLTQVLNNYGGSVSFSYIETPTNSTYDVWTVEAVATRTVSPGIGPNQVTNYTYSNGPAYYGSSWSAEFRGFGQVTETDGAGNYIQHFFYTTGTAADGKDAEKLNGQEYDTKYYNQGGSLLDEKVFDWNHSTINERAAGSSLGSWGLGNGIIDIAASQTQVYALYNDPGGNDMIYSFTNTGSSLGSWYTGSNNIIGIAASPTQVYALYDNPGGNDMILSFTNTGSSLGSWYTGSNNIIGIAASATQVYGLYDNPSGDDVVCCYTNTGSSLGSWYTGNNGIIRIAASPTQVYGLYDNPGGNDMVCSYTYTGSSLGSWGLGNGIIDIAASQTQVYTLYNDPGGNDMVYSFTNTGSSLGSWYTGSNIIIGIAASPTQVYVLYDNPGGNDTIYSFTNYFSNYCLKLNSITDTVGTKTSRIRYIYDNYGNVTTEYRDGDTSTTADDYHIQTDFYANTSANILSAPAKVTVYDYNNNLKSDTRNYYDNASSYTTPPTKGNLTRIQQYKDASTWNDTYYIYDTNGNMLSLQDPNSNTTSWTYDPTYHTYAITQTSAISGLSESATWDYGTNNILSHTNLNGRVTSYEYDTFKRLTKVIKPGDSSGSPSVQYNYNSWGTINQQNLETRTKISGSNYYWQKQYFDGLGRVVQVQNIGESGHTVISSTTAFNNRGLVDETYVSQDIASALTAYYAPVSGWVSTKYAYDGLSRVTTQTNLYHSTNQTSISHDYSNPWQDLVTDELNNKTRDYYDAFGRLVKVEEYSSYPTVYSTTTYAYDILGNLIQVQDNAGNTTTNTFNWLGWKLSSSDPDMGMWYYKYDNNGNLASQVDAKVQATNLYYDALNRLKGKTFTLGVGNPSTYVRPSDPGTYTEGYTYDAYDGTTQFGKGLRTGMYDSVSDSSHPSTYKYDNRGRLIEEKRWEYSSGTWNSYTTSYTYDGLDRAVTIVYPSGETVTNTYNGRGLPYSVSGTASGNTNLVGSTLYNQLGEITEINLNNGLRTTFGYYQTGGARDTTGGYYGQLWEIKVLPQSGGSALQNLRYSWDASGNMGTRQDVLTSQTETFGYDFLDRLTSVSGAYSNSFTYNQIGNITSMNGASYTYGSKPQAVTQVGTTVGTSQNFAINEASKCLNFDGNDYVTVSGSQLKVGEDWSNTTGTYEFWIKTTSTTGTQVIMNKGSIKPYLQNGYLNVYLSLGGYPGNYDIQTNRNVANGSWHYVMILVKSSNYDTQARVFVDGTSATDVSFDLVYLANTGSNPLYIGQSGSGTQYFVGQLDEIRVSSTDRSGEASLNWAGGRGKVLDAAGSVALFHMNDTASSLTDSSSYHSNGTINGATYTTGIDPLGTTASTKSILFTGSTSSVGYIQANDSLLNIGEPSSPTDSATYEFWMKTTSGTGTQYLMDKGSIRAFIQNGVLRCDFNYANSTIWSGNSGINVADGLWHYVALTTNPSSSRIYVDGTLRANFTSNQRLKNTAYNYVRLGSSYTGQNLLAGQLEEIRLSQIVRSDTEITSNWAQGYGKALAVDGNTIILYHADDSGTTLIDASSHRNGIISNSYFVDGLVFPSSAPSNSISVTSPVLGKEWVAGANQNITWNPQGVTGNLRIELTSNEFVVSVITSSVPASAGSYAWNIPITQTALCSYQIKFSTGVSTYTYDANGNMTTRGDVTAVLNESYAGSNDTSETLGTGGSYTAEGQTFTPAVTHALTIVKATFFRSTGTNGNIYCDIYATSAGLPTGASLGQASISASISQTPTLLVWNFATPIAVISGVKYAAVFTSTASNPIYMNLDNTSPTYTGGTWISKTGTTWNSPYSNYDALFEEWGSVNQSLTWDAENHITAVSGGGASATYVYDGNGNRIKKTENGQTILYVNQFYEKNLTTGVVTTYYYLGGKMIAERAATTLRFFHQDSLNSTSLVTSATGTSLGTTQFYPFGSTRSGSVPTDEKFTGQRLDSTTGLYYYGARYYDPAIGRFISADTMVPSIIIPQALNRYSYVLNNPLRYIDPTGHSWRDALNFVKGFVKEAVMTVSSLAWSASLPGGIINGYNEAKIIVNTIKSEGVLQGTVDILLSPVTGWADHCSENLDAGAEGAGALVFDSVLAIGSVFIGGAAVGAEAVGGLKYPIWVKDSRTFVSYTKQYFEKNPGRPLTTGEANSLISTARQYGVDVDAKPGDLAGHPTFPPWDVPHIHIGNDRVHVPVPPGFELPE